MTDSDSQKVRAMLADELVNSHGWGLIKEYISGAVASNTARLLNIDPTETLKIFQYQSEVKTLQALAKHIEKLASEYTK